MKNKRSSWWNNTFHYRTQRPPNRGHLFVYLFDIFKYLVHTYNKRRNCLFSVKQKGAAIMDRSGYKHRKHTVHPAKPVEKAPVFSDEVKGWLLPLAVGVLSIIEYIWR